MVLAAGPQRCPRGWHTGMRTKEGDPTHLPELADPCCVPALGEFTRITPRGILPHMLAAAARATKCASPAPSRQPPNARAGRDFAARSADALRCFSNADSRLYGGYWLMHGGFD